MLTKSGAKLLDFGVAKLKLPVVEPQAGATGDATTSPGVLIGTVPYMSPEQLEGKDVDGRSDIFSLGTLLHEMVTGQRAFQGQSDASIISAILSSEPPPVSSLRPIAPPALDRLVHACLVKEPDARRQSADDVAQELRGLLSEAGSGETARPPVARRRRWRRSAAALLAVVLVGTLGWGLWFEFGPASTEPVRTDLALPEGTNFTGGAITALAMAPDGSAVVYSAVDEKGPRLYWQRLDGSRPRPIPGTDGAVMPFFSPDGSQLGFGLRSALVTLALPSGQPGEAAAFKPLVELPEDILSLRGASWGEDGTILFTPRTFGGLWAVPARGGPPRELTRPDPGKNEAGHLWPSSLPGGRAALFTVWDASSRQDRSAIAVLSLDTGRWQRILEGGSYARYLPPGYLVYACNGSLLAVRFDIRTLKPVGSPIPVASGVGMIRFTGLGVAWYDVATSGALAFIPRANVPLRSSLVWVDGNGQATPVADDQRGFVGRLDLTKDGRKLAVVTDEGFHFNILVYDLDSRRWEPLATGADADCPVWSAAGDQLAFSSNSDGAFNLYAVRPGEPGPVRRLTRSPRAQCAWSWSPDGRSLAFTERTGAGWETWVLPFEGDGKPGTPWRWIPDGQRVSAPAFSPDGRWLAYNSLETGNWEVHVRPFPGPGSRQTVSGSEGGFGPFWTRDGRGIDVPGEVRRRQPGHGKGRSRGQVGAGLATARGLCAPVHAVVDAQRLGPGRRVRPGRQACRRAARPGRPAGVPQCDPDPELGGGRARQGDSRERPSMTPTFTAEQPCSATCAAAAVLPLSPTLAARAHRGEKRHGKTLDEGPFEAQDWRRAHRGDARCRPVAPGRYPVGAADARAAHEEEAGTAQTTQATEARRRLQA